MKVASVDARIGIRISCIFSGFSGTSTTVLAIDAAEFDKPLQQNYRRSLDEDVKSAAVGTRHHSRHRLANRVERVDFAKRLFRQQLTQFFVVVAEFQTEAEQRALGLVADVRRRRYAAIRVLVQNSKPI